MYDLAAAVWTGCRRSKPRRQTTERATVSANDTNAARVNGARLLRAAAHPIRLMILEALADRAQCVKELNSLVPIIQPHLSQHMAVLRKAELVDCHAQGALRCYYLLRPALIKKTIRLLREEHPPRRRSRASILREIRQVAKKNASGDRGRSPPA
jgi:ArsR family transcriptional regulator